MKLPSGLYIDSPAYPVMAKSIAYWGVTSANGNIFGTTLTDIGLATEPGYVGAVVKILTGDAAGQEETLILRGVGGTYTVDSPFTNAAGAAVQIVASTLFVISRMSDAIRTAMIASRPTVVLYEGWQDEAGINPLMWTVTNPATGAAWARAADGGFLRAASQPNANENCRIRSNQRWITPWGIGGQFTIVQRWHLQFEFRLNNLVNVDNALTLWGLTTGVADTRATNNIVGFALVGAGNALQTVTDNGGAEEINTGFGEDLTQWCKMEIEGDCNTNITRFFLNNNLIAAHATVGSTRPKYLNFYHVTNGGGASQIRIGVIRFWYEDFVR